MNFRTKRFSLYLTSATTQQIFPRVLKQRSTALIKFIYNLLRRLIWKAKNFCRGCSESSKIANQFYFLFYFIDELNYSCTHKLTTGLLNNFFLTAFSLVDRSKKKKTSLGGKKNKLPF